MNYEPTIGLEIHVQLKTKSKMFCRCSAATFGEAPNSRTCPVCLGLPGALPVTNGEAVRLALLAGEALGSKHPSISKFDRKNYFYPDLPKGYQISQYDLPLNVGGEVVVGDRKIKLTRAHLEEDTGKLLHEKDATLIDFNRSGLPLLEIVSDPVITSAVEAELYGQKIQLLMRYAGVSEADMEKGSLRVDANVSIRPVGAKTLGTKVEVKNMNSFRSVERALEFEIERQTKLLEGGKKIIQETRGWNEGQGVTVSQRVKEGSDDYRYFPEPDLPAIEIRSKLIAELRESLTDRSPDRQKEKLINDAGLDSRTAEILVSDYDLQSFYSRALADSRSTFTKNEAKVPTDLAKKVANWLVTDYLAHFKGRNVTWAETPVTPAHLAELIYLFDQGKISAASAKSVMTEMFNTGTTPSKIVASRGFLLQSDIVKLTDIARAVLSHNPQAVSDYRHGKAQAFGFLLGQMRKETDGQADPTIARQALEKVLQSSK